MNYKDLDIDLISKIVEVTPEDVESVIELEKKSEKKRISGLTNIKDIETQIYMSSTSLADFQRLRISMGLRMGRIASDSNMFMLETSKKLISKQEAYHRYQLRKLMELHPLASWIEGQRGIGLEGFGRYLGSIKSLSRFPNVGKLWKYSGMHTKDGLAPRKVKGEKIDWSPEARTILYMIGESFIKEANSEYRKTYLEKKQEYFSRERVGESGCPMGQIHTNKAKKVYACITFDNANNREKSAHVHNASRRFAIKKLLIDAWVAWQAVAPEGYIWKQEEKEVEMEMEERGEI